jgi:hypothetical protein
MFHLNQLKETSVDVLKSDDTELQDIAYSFTASNMQARHSDATSYLTLKIIPLIYEAKGVSCLVVKEVIRVCQKYVHHPTMLAIVRAHQPKRCIIDAVSVALILLAP